MQAHDWKYCSYYFLDICDVTAGRGGTLMLNTSSGVAYTSQERATSTKIGCADLPAPGTLRLDHVSAHDRLTCLI